MPSLRRYSQAVGFVLMLAGPTLADDGPPIVPATRTELKQFLEDSKRNVPRLPLPPQTDAEKEKMAHANFSGGDWSVYNNGRTRKYYLPAELADLSGLRGDDPAMSLGYRFQTMLFWIVSRGNNCTYCMGHQESKLAVVGMDDDQIAALDGDWSTFPEKERAAFAFARKLTFTPQAITSDDVAGLKRQFTNPQVLEIINAVGNFNAMNRWTGALRIPQEGHRIYLSPTSEKYRDATSRQAPLDPEARAAGRSRARTAGRAPLESRAQVEAALAASKTREPRLPLVDDSRAREIVAGDWSGDPLPEWVRLLANFPKSGPARVAVHRASQTKGLLDPVLRAQIAWISARNDRAWYALGHARKRLSELGQGDEAIFALDRADAGTASPAQGAVFSLARKLTVGPALIEDADIRVLRKHYSDKEVAEIVFQVTEAAYFDRLTESAGLRLEK